MTLSFARSLLVPLGIAWLVIAPSAAHAGIVPVVPVEEVSTGTLGEKGDAALDEEGTACVGECDWWKDPGASGAAPKESSAAPEAPSAAPEAPSAAPEESSAASEETSETSEASSAASEESSAETADEGSTEEESTDDE